LAAEQNLNTEGLSQEEEILARVVIDLGLAKAKDVVRAIDVVSRTRAAGGSVSLAENMQESGCLNPRFASAVQKAVRTRMAAAGPKAASGGKRDPMHSARTAPPPPAARSAPPPPPAPPAPAPPAEEPAAPRGLNPTGPKMAPSRESLTDDEPDLASLIPGASVYARAPKGEGFSVRSKTAVASAWAQHRKGAGAGSAEAKDREPQQPEAGAPPPGGPAARPSSPKSDLASLVDPGAASEALPAPPPGVGRVPQPMGFGSDGIRERVTPGRGARKAAKKAVQKKKRRKGYKRQRFTSSGVTQQIDVGALRSELGLGGGKATAAPSEGESKPGPEPEAFPKGEKRKAAALQAFVKRVVPGRAYQQCLDVIIRRRLTATSPGRLAEEARCREREARRVLEHWPAEGLVRKGQDAYDLMQYQFAPNKADLDLIRNFMYLWNDAPWHQRLLTWMIEQEGTAR
jgi:hypothetical protein